MKAMHCWQMKARGLPIKEDDVDVKREERAVFWCSELKAPLSIGAWHTFSATTSNSHHLNTEDNQEELAG